MAETGDEVFERVLAEEQGKGTSPAVAQARAKAARVRAQKGLPIDAAAAAQAASEQKPRAHAEPGVPAETEVRAAEAPPAEEAAPAPAAEVPVAAAPSAPRAAAPAPVAVAAPPAAPPRGRGAAARAARADGGGTVPERIQRLLAVVKPEAIQRVEKEPMDRVNVWPHLMASEFLSLLVVTAFLVLFSSFVDAPFRELADINQTPNPSKAPWYFLGLQELLRYFHPQIAGVTTPQWIVLGLIAAPFIDRNPSTKPEDRKLAIVMFTIFLLFFAILTIVGSLFRGQGFNFVYPWDVRVGEIFEL